MSHPIITEEYDEKRPEPDLKAHKENSIDKKKKMAHKITVKVQKFPKLKMPEYFKNKAKQLKKLSEEK